LRSIIHKKQKRFKLKTKFMKKLFLLSIGTAFSIGAFAQSAAVRHAHAANTNVAAAAAFFSHNRTTAIGSVDTLGHIAGTDTLANYIAGNDSGYCAGTDVYGDMGYAERFDFSTADSSLQVLGVIALFGGTVSPASTHNVVFNVWSQGPQVSAGITGRPHVFESGFPNTVLATQTVPFTQLGIGASDTPKIHMFTTPSAYLNHSFFVGCTISYSWATLAGDTIGLYSNLDGERVTAVYTVSGADTIINNKNATQYNDATWNDNATSNFNLYYNYFLFPIVKVGAANLSVNGITTRNFTFFGSYPNPTADVTNIKFAVANSTDVTITITDMAGRTVNTINQMNLCAGTHIVPVSTSNLPAGEYTYLVRTAAGEGMASKFTVIK